MIDSIFEPYRNKIEQLLFNGLNMKEAHQYLVKYFGLYSSYSGFHNYVVRSGLDWFMQDRIPKKMRERIKRREMVECIKEYIEKHGYSPSFLEIGNAVGIRSEGKVKEYIQVMIEEGMIESDETELTSRAIRVPCHESSPIV